MITGFDKSISKAALPLVLIALLSPNMTATFAADSQKVSARHEAMLKRGETLVTTEEKDRGKRFVKAKILINATPHVVWDTVHEERQHDPDLAYSKVIEQDKNVAMLEQKFALIPVVGTSTCLMRNVEVPLQRIDYNMVKSDRFKSMEGSWVLTPAGTDNATYLELSSHLDIGLPFPRPLVEGATAKKLQRRLQNVKKMAEASQKNKVAQQKTVQAD